MDQASLIKLQASDVSCGTVTGGSYEDDGHKAAVTAANRGYDFIGWYKGNTQKSTEDFLPSQWDRLALPSSTSSVSTTWPGRSRCGKTLQALWERIHSIG